MQPEEYEKLAAVEDRMWWFRGTHANMLAAFARTSPPAGPALDAGCGTGGFLARLAKAAPSRRVFGLDADAVACATARRKSGATVCRGSVNALPFADGAFAAIFSADVLCHAKVEEAAALGEFHRCLADGGTLVLNLPSYDWLLSPHDHAVHNVRRYTRRRVQALLRSAGFAAVRTSYVNTILFPLMAVRRKLGGDAGSDVKLYPAPVEAACRAVMALENLLLRLGLRFPFGGSLLAVAVKHG